MSGSAVALVQLVGGLVLSLPGLVVVTFGVACGLHERGRR